MKNHLFNMSKKSIDHGQAGIREKAKKEQVLESLMTAEGRCAFYGMFEKKIAELRSVIRSGAGAGIKRGIERAMKDMRETANRMRERSDEAGKVIEEARQKYQELLEEIDQYEVGHSS